MSAVKDASAETTTATAETEGRENTCGRQASSTPGGAILDAGGKVSSETDRNGGENPTKDPVEQGLGISAYLSSDTPGFYAVLKARYSDFIVHEVGMDGKIARLDSMEPKVISSETKGENTTENASETGPGGDSSTLCKPATVEDDGPNSRKRKSHHRDNDSGDNVDSIPEHQNLVKCENDSTGQANRDRAASSSILVDVEGNVVDDAWWQQTEQELASFVDKISSQQVVSFLRQVQRGREQSADQDGKQQDKTSEGTERPQNEEDKNQPKFVKLPHCPDKMQRRNLHEWIRSRLGTLAAADTVDEDPGDSDKGSETNKCGETADERNETEDSIRAGKKRRKTDGSNNNQKPTARKVIRVWHKSFEKEMPNYGNFRTTEKRRGRGKQPSAPPGKPYLRFVLYKENMDTGTAVQQIQRRSGGGGGGRGGRGGNRGGRFGGGNRRGGALRMGYAGMKDKRGITCQFITVPSTTPIPSLCSWNRQGTGGGHTKSAGVSVLRVGSFEYVSDELQLGRLQGNRFDIVLRNVQPLEGKDRSATKAFLERAAGALRQNGFINYFGVQRFGKFHDTHLTGIEVVKGDYEKAIGIIMEPKPGEREDIVQARRTWQDRFNADGGSCPDRSTAEKTCAAEVSRSFNRFMSSELAIVNSLARSPLDYKRAFSCISKTMRMMFLHALQSYLWNHAASYRVERMGHSVLPGDLVYDDDDPGSGDGWGLPAVKAVTEEDVASGKYSLDDVVLPLIGSKTRDPDNDSAKVFDELLELHGLTRRMINRIEDRDFNCAGDYRKLICRPSDVDFDLIEYKDAFQPLIQTDLMKLHEIGIDSVGEGEESGSLLAMIVGFTLPSSSYATVALRELMKQPTSGEFQGELKLSNAEI